MKTRLGLLLLIVAAVCAALSYALLRQSFENSLSTPWVAWPGGALISLLLGLALLLGVKRAIGAVFLLGAAVCMLFAYANGGPAWGERFDARRMMQQGGIWAALGGLV